MRILRAWRGRPRALAVCYQAATTSRRLPWITAPAGAVGASLYAVQSSHHMVVMGRHDDLLVGSLLSLLGAAIGWTAGASLAGEEVRLEPGGQQTAGGETAVPAQGQ